jgi:MFS family permease
MDALEPTKARNKVIIFGVILAAVQYVDRICISRAEGLIRRDLGLNKDDMSLIFMAFTISYALFEIPTGLMGDKFGPRKTLVRVVLWWSFFTMATGVMWNKASMFICRFLFGAGEAGCFPNLTRAFSTWLRPNEKVRAQAIVWFFARMGGAVTPLLVTLLLGVISWKMAFFIFGWLGVIWAFFFWRWFRDDPKDHPEVNQAERALLAANPPVARHDPVPWGRFLSSATPWLLWLQYFCFSYCWYFYVTWLPTFLKEKYPDVNLYTQAALAGIPLFCGAFGNMAATFLIPRLQKWSGTVLRTRRILGVCGLGLAGVCFLFPSRFIEYPLVVMFAMGAASFFGDLTMPCSWGTCMDVGGKFAGTFSGSMNMMGNFGGVLSPWAFNKISATAGGWALAFDISAGVYILAGLCWLFIDPVKPLDQDKKAEPAPASA